MDTEGGSVELCGATRIVELADGEECAGRELQTNMRLLCGFWKGWQDEFICVGGCHGVAIQHRDYDGMAV